MSFTSGNLDSLLNMTFNVDTLANLIFVSGTTANGTVSSVTAKTGASTYGTFDSLKVTSINDATNTIVVTGTYTSQGDGYYGGGGTTTVPWVFDVVGQVGSDLLLAANGSAAISALSSSAVASLIQSGSASTLSSDLFVFATDGSAVGASASQTLTFAPLSLPTESVAMVLAAPPSAAVTVTDSAAAVQGSLNALQGLVAGGDISGITLTDQGTPSLAISATQASADAGVLGKISGSYGLAVTDSMANVLSNIGALNSLAAAGHALSITLTDSATPDIMLTPAQLAADTAVLKDVSSQFVMTVDGSAANITVAGIAGRGTVVALSGTASQFTLTPNGDGVGFTLTNGSGTDHFSTITALQFSDGTDFIANAPSSSQITSGNVVELYSAVLARVPDVGGVAFYQAAATANPGLTLNTLAQYFLGSDEYKNNPAHAYAQSAQGDANFITDTYTNLLHRAPDTGAVPFYQNVIAQFTNGLTPGTAAYAAAQLAGHAQVLVYFSVSPEFLSDVQITAQHPADAQHFLYLI